MNAHPTVVVPTYNDDERLSLLLPTLANHGLRVVVVDGQVSSHTRALVAAHDMIYLVSKPGRGQQIDTALRCVTADWVWILHADSVVSDQCVQRLQEVVAAGSPCWGRFDVRIAGLLTR